MFTPASLPNHMLAGPNAPGARCGGTRQSWGSRRRMRRSRSIGRRQRIVIEIVHMQPQYTPATQGATCARTSRWTTAARDMTIRMLASRWCSENSPWALLHVPRLIAVGRRDAVCLHASLFHPLILRHSLRTQHTCKDPHAPRPNPTGRGCGGTPGSHFPHHRAPRDWARMRILAASFLKKVALYQLLFISCSDCPLTACKLPRSPHASNLWRNLPPCFPLTAYQTHTHTSLRALSRTRRSTQHPSSPHTHPSTWSPDSPGA
jgi:hypothetical protein